MSSGFAQINANCRGRPTGPLIAAMLALCLSWAGISHADLPSDLGHGPTSAKVSLPPSKHWVWVNDFVFPHMVDGMAYLVDGDSGRYLGTLSTGFGFAHFASVAATASSSIRRKPISRVERAASARTS